MFDFAVLERAGITQQQFADLVGVSRVTVYTWLHERFKPRPAMRKRIERAIHLLQQATTDGRLPVQRVNYKEHVEAKLQEIRKAIREEV
jgi:transcriptional regulator with XRE-family HTH domain